MPLRRLASLIALTVLLASSLIVSLPAQQAAPAVSPSLFAEMQWRNIGPYRAGRDGAYLLLDYGCAVA